MRPALEQRPLALVQPLEVARPVGLGARVQDHVVGALDMGDGIDLHEGEPVDHGGKRILARLGERPVVRSRQPLGVEDQAARGGAVEGEGGGGGEGQIGWRARGRAGMGWHEPVRETNMVQFHGLPTETVRALQDGAPDANGQPPERAVSDGGGNPCRHCLGMIAEGDGMLVLAHRPFETTNPYAEVGPIFLHARECEAYLGDEGLPPALDSPAYIVRGYGADERIVYGTGGVVERDAITSRARALLDDERVTFVDVRSAANNCWQARVGEK